MLGDHFFPGIFDEPHQAEHDGSEVVELADEGDSIRDQVERQQRVGGGTRGEPPRPLRHPRITRQSRHQLPGRHDRRSGDLPPSALAHVDSSAAMAAPINPALNPNSASTTGVFGL